MHELSHLVFKRFSTTVMTQMILTLINILNIFSILNIYLNVFVILNEILKL